MARTTSKTGLDFIAAHEGLRLTAYKPVASERYWTIGYGHYGPDVKQGMTISRARALDLLRGDVREAEAAVNRLGLPLNANQFDALVSAVFNLGPGVLDRGRSLGDALHARQYGKAANALLLYVKGGRPLRTLPGLVRRRREERALFLKPVRRRRKRYAPRELQRTLKRIGFPVKVDGNVGPETRAALREFQRGWYGPKGRWRLKPTGRQDDRTYSALKHSVAHRGMVSPHFRYVEFASKRTGKIVLYRELVEGLERLRPISGPIRILSAYRDYDVTGQAKDSQHEVGTAIDPASPLPHHLRVLALGVFSGVGWDGGTGRVRHVDVRHAGPKNTKGRDGRNMASPRNPATWEYK